MSTRYSKSTNVGGYLPYHFNALQAQTPIDSSTHGHVLGYVTVGTLGTSLVVSLYNGATLMHKITPTQPQTFFYDQVYDQGLQVQLAGTGFDISISALPNPI